MNRLFRHIRRNNAVKSNRSTFLKSKTTAPLRVEYLEPRVMLTTLVLKAPDMEADPPFLGNRLLQYRYADPQTVEPGAEDIDAWNFLTIGTLSGLPPAVDVVVEILDYRGDDIGGNLYVDNMFVDSLGGGPAGAAIIEEVPANILGRAQQSIYAMATSPTGINYGIGSDGRLYTLDVVTGRSTLVGDILDTDNKARQSFVSNPVVDFTQAAMTQGQSIHAATYQNGLIYAVANGPVTFNESGVPTSWGQVLITIDPAQLTDVLTGANYVEAEPVGRDTLGDGYYANSVITTPLGGERIRTIVDSDDPNVISASAPGASVTLLGFNAPGLEEEPANSFVAISAADGASDSVIVSTNTIYQFDDEVVLDGLAYDEKGRLFGLSNEYEEGQPTSGILVYIPDLTPGEDDEAFIDVVEYGTRPNSDIEIVLTSMTFDFLNNLGYATDPTTGTLYQINLSGLREEYEDGLVAGFIPSGLADIYSMYIASSTPDIFITLTYVEIDDSGIHYMPQEGEPTYLYTDEDNAEITTPDNAGGAMIGTRAYTLDDDLIWSSAGSFFSAYDVAGYYDPQTGETVYVNQPHGAWPGGEVLRPGIHLAKDLLDADGDGIIGEPQDIGKIQIGGGVFGDVIIEGSIGTFYAGYLASNRFEVDGDMDNLIVNTQAGGIVESDGSWMPVGRDLMSMMPSPVDAFVEVWGEMGGFYGNGVDGHWGLPVRVHGRDDAPSFPGVMEVNFTYTDDGNPNNDVYIDGVMEIERKITNLPHQSQFYMGGLDEEGGSWVLTNDTPYSAQYVGDVNGEIVIYGYNESPTFDPADYYCFGVMAGQTVKIEVFDVVDVISPTSGNPILPTSTSRYSSGGIALYDSNHELVATYSTADLLRPAGILPLEFTAEIAGVYTLQVISGAPGPMAYRAEISGVSPTTLGGGNIMGEMRSGAFHAYPTSLPNIYVADGNCGAVSVGGTGRGVNVQINDGDLAAFRVGANGLPLGDLVMFGVGRVDEGPAYGFSLEWSNTGASMAAPDANVISVSGDIGQVISMGISAVDIYADGDVQSVWMGSEIQLVAEDSTGNEDATFVEWSGGIAAGGNIGEINVNGNFGPAVLQEDGTQTYAGSIPGFFANYDGLGAPGVIDVIKVSGDFGSSGGTSSERVVSVGSAGGNVRFVDIGGNIYNTTAGSSGDLGPYEFSPGLSVVVTDDSGVSVRISPGHTGENVEDYLFGATPPADFNLPSEGDGGVITLKVLPVRSQLLSEYNPMAPELNQKVLGFAIVEITSTDGLRITTAGGPVEIGSALVEGRVDHTVAFSGPSPISILRLETSAPVVSDETTTTDTQQGDDEEPVILPNTGITRIINTTLGDIVSMIILGENSINAAAAGSTITVTDRIVTDDPDLILNPIAQVEVVSVRGNLGLTHNNTGQKVFAPILMPATETGDDVAVQLDPGGTQRSGLLSLSDIASIQVYGALADVDVRGNVESIMVDVDNSNRVNEFDGLIGPIEIYGHLDYLSMGDGLPQPGTGRRAEAGVFVYGELDRVFITGPGREIAGPIFASSAINYVSVKNGAVLTGYNYYSSGGERVNSAYMMAPTLAVTNEMDHFSPLDGDDFQASGNLGIVDVSGVGSSITGAGLLARNINLVQTGGGASGIFDSRFYAIRDFSTGGSTINQIKVTNGNFHDNMLTAYGNINLIQITSGDIQDCEIRGNNLIGKISADAISRTDIDAQNKLDSVTVKGSIFDLVIEAGELGTLTAQGILPATGSQSQGSITGSGIYVSGAVGKIQTKGDLISTIHVTGWDGDLKNLQVGGDLGTPTGGEIIVDGRIGNISVGGDFLAELLVNWDPSPVSPANPQGPHEKYDPAYYGRLPGPSIQMMRVGGDILGIADIGGDVSMIMCGGDFGTFGETFHVHGNLGMMMIGMGSPGGGNLESSLVVDGNAPMVFVFGDVNGKIDVTENFGTLLLLARGAGNRADLNGSITVGGNFTTLIIIGGDIAQTDVVDGEPLQITVAGKGPRTIVIGSDLGGTTVYNGTDSVSYDGSLLTGASIISTDDVRRIRFGEDIQEGSRIVIDGDLDELVVEGSISGQIHVTGNLGRLTTTNVTSTAVITAGGDIGFINVSGTVGSGTYILAGYNPGVDLATLTDGVFTATELTVDGTDVDPNEQAYAADITSVNIGLLWNSVVAAGVHPGNNNLFGDMDGSDFPADGTSQIGVVILGDVLGDGEVNPDPFGIFADTAIKSLRIGTRTYIPPSGTITLANGFRALEVGDTAIGDGGVVFQQGLPFNGTINGVGVSVMLIGPGTGEIVPGNTTIESITLTNTTLATMLIVRANGNATIDVEELITADDAALGTLMLDNSAAGVAMEMTIGGGMNRLQLNGVAPGSDIQINGKLGSGDLGVVRGTAAAPTTITVAGDAPRLQTVSATDNVTIVADNVGQLMSRGDFDAVLNAAGINGVLTSAIVMGDMGGVLAAVDDIGRIMVFGTTSGAISAGGDLQYLMTRGLYRAVVTAAGNLKQVQVLGDVEFSTLAGGLAIGLDGELFNDDDDEITALRGDVERVWIMGDFIQSNVAAGVAPGADLFFGTDDDILQSRVVENMDAPTIIDVYFPDEFSIAVTFKDVAQRESSNIKSVTITGEIEGSSSPLDTFAFIASGKVQSVFFNRQAFSGEENVLRSEISLKGISPTSIVNDDIDSLAEALAAAFRVQTDGLDNLFDTADDIYLYGDDDADTDPTVYVTFDEATNTAVFHKTDGVAFNVWGTNYYRITLDAAQIVNRQGVPLDGEFLGISGKGEMLPTGDGVPGGDFVYTFAVGDIGSGPWSAFDQYGGADFPVGPTWQYTSTIGDDPSRQSTSRYGELDFFRLNGLNKGDVLTLECSGGAFYLWDVPEVVEPEIVSIAVGSLGLDHLEELTASEILLSNTYQAVGYNADPDADADGIEDGLFYLVDVINGLVAPIMVEDPHDPDEQIELTTETLSDIYTTETGDDVDILAIKAMDFGYDEDDDGVEELWMVVTVFDNFAGASRDSLLRIANILDPASAMMNLSVIDIAAQGFGDVVSLAYNKAFVNVESPGELIALDNATQTLIKLDKRVYFNPGNTGILSLNPNYGAVSILGGQVGNLQQADRASYDVTAIDFDSNGVLFGLENNSDVVVRIYTGLILTQGYAPLELVSRLEAGDYQTFTVYLDSFTGDVYPLAARTEAAELLYVSTSPLSDLLFPYNEMPTSYWQLNVPMDGDYLVSIVGTGTYTFSVNVFNDGNSDFGVTTTPNGFDYSAYAVSPNDVPVDLSPGSEDIDPDPTNPNSYQNHPFYPIKVAGDGLTPGVADSLIIDAALENALDVDVYMLQLQEGQELTIDIEADTLFGGDLVGLLAGVYNKDLESTTTIANLIGGPDVLLPAQSPDPVFTIQAVYQMPNHDGVDDPIIDPMTYDPLLDGRVGTYYIVVSGATNNTPYQLKITTSAPKPIETPPSQLVYLAFDGGIAEYLARPDRFRTLDIDRPPFDDSDFNLAGQCEFIINGVIARVEEIYREAGLSADEIEFTTEKPNPNLGQTYTTVFIGGTASITIEGALLGVANSVDRDNAQRDGAACSFSETIAWINLKDLSPDLLERRDEVIYLLANNTTHELGHTLGLEHCTEVVEGEESPNNIMNYNSGDIDRGIQEFAERNDYWYQPIGYVNEVDILLRNIGSGTEMGY